MAARADALEHIRVVEETAAALLVFSTFEKIDMARQRNEASAAVERLRTGLRTLGKQVFGQLTAQIELFDARITYSRF